MAYTHFFLAILLVPLMRLGGAQSPCPTLCHCTLEILNCSRIANSPGFHEVPLPSPATLSHPFTYLDFTGNSISSIGKEAWKAYPWAESLVLKGNSLTRLQNSSLEGLLSLTYLDLSCNKIHSIERNAFEAVPFLQIIYLSSNAIEQIAYGTFRAWHGMQFLLKVDLSHNPLGVIHDSYFYRLPLLKLLDLSATEVTPRILGDLLQASLQLRTLIVPKMMSCCLCRIQKDIEALCDTVKLSCAELCAVTAALCAKEEPWMQEEVTKALEIRKWNGTTLVNILPEEAILNNAVPERTEHHTDAPTSAHNDSSLHGDFNKLKSAKPLTQVKADEPLDVNWADTSELKRLYFLVSLLQAALKETIAEPENDSLEAILRNELPAQVSETSTDEATDASLRKERRVRKVRRKAIRENWSGRNQRQEDILFRLTRDGRQVAMTTVQSVVKPGVFELHNEAASWRKLAEGLDSQRALPFLRPRQVALRSSWKRSIPDSPTNTLEPTSSIAVDKSDNGLMSLSSDGKSIMVLGNGAQILAKEELLNQLLHRSDPLAGDSKSKTSAVDSEPSLNELLPGIKLSQGTNWEHQRTSASPLLNFAPQDDYFRQRELFEAELNKRLASLIPSAPVRKLLSHVIRILKMDCTAPTLRAACAKLVSRTGLLMKLLHENVGETSLWKLYFWPPKNVTNVTTASSRGMEKPSSVVASQGAPGYSSGNRLLLATSVTAIIVALIAAICLIQICSQRSAAKENTFLGKRKKSLPDLERSRTASLLVDKPLWLKDMYQSQDEMQEKTMADQLHDEESSEEVDVVTWGHGRSSLPEPPLKKLSSKTLSVPTYEISPATPVAQPPPPLPPPSSAPSRKPSVKKGSDAAGGTLEAAGSKAASSAADEGEENADEEKSESPAAEATSEAAESGEAEEEGEGEEEEEEEEEEDD